MLLLQLLILICLSVIFYQDMQYRAVYWICFPILAVLLFFVKYKFSGMAESLTDAIYGLSFFAVQLFLLWVYFAVKNRKPVNITKHYLGIGDILFLMAAAFYLSPVNYVVFYILSLIVILMYTLIKRFFIKEDSPYIPLAGLQAVILGLVLVFSIFKPGIVFYNDNWIYGI